MLNRRRVRQGSTQRAAVSCAAKKQRNVIITFGRTSLQTVDVVRGRESERERKNLAQFNCMHNYAQHVAFRRRSGTTYVVDQLATPLHEHATRIKPAAALTQRYIAIKNLKNQITTFSFPVSFSVIRTTVKNIVAKQHAFLSHASIVHAVRDTIIARLSGCLIFCPSHDGIAFK